MIEIIKTQNGNFLATDGNFCAYFDAKFNFMKHSTVAEWDWAVGTWDAEVSESDNTNLTQYFESRQSKAITDIESISTLDEVYRRIMDEADKIGIVVYSGSAGGGVPDYTIMFGNEKESYDSLVEFMASKKDELLSGFSGTVAYLKLHSYVQYGYADDFIELSTTRLSSGNVLCEIVRYDNYYNWDGRNADTGCNKVKQSFILNVAC